MTQPALATQATTVSYLHRHQSSATGEPAGWFTAAPPREPVATVRPQRSTAMRPPTAHTRTGAR
ncbi:MAG: hypothetical protein KJ777_06895 [Actinobacteria bacterium]|nr:hypothetical protein [Actinomycetota bacterium]